MANSGWTNDAIDSLTVPTGATSGERVIIANQANGDAIDIYDTANQLVFSIDGNGRLVSYSTLGTSTAVIVGGGLVFEDTTQNPQIAPRASGSTDPTGTTLLLDGGVPQNAVGGITPAFLSLNTNTSLGSPWISAGQRDVQGAVLQTDSTQDPPINNIVHVQTYSIATDGTGAATFSHNCGFRDATGAASAPVAGFLMGVNGVGATFPYQSAWFASPFTATTAHAAFKTETGAAIANTTVGVFGVFYG